MRIMLKLVNRSKLLRDFYLEKERVSGLPLELVIETTNKCNLNCIMCTRKNMKRPIGFMEMSLYQKIIDEISSYMELVYLHGLGEPLFHPQIFEMIAYAKNKGLNIGLSTNATLLTKEKTQKLILSGLDYLIIALDATKAETYAKVRGGKNFDQVVKNVRGYLELKKQAKKSPFTVLQFVKLKENMTEDKKFRQIWQNSGADVIRVKPVIDLLRSEKNGKKSRRPCFYLWRQLNMISWDGKIVTPCCMDTDGEYPLGDVSKDSIAGIWNNPKMIALRKAQLSGAWKKLPLCRDCTYPQPSFPGKIGAMVFPDIAIKKMLPILERLSFGKFVIYE